jgi:hypothetical protein
MVAVPWLTVRTGLTGARRGGVEVDGRPLEQRVIDHPGGVSWWPGSACTPATGVAKPYEVVQLDGNPSLFDPFAEKPRRMHRSRRARFRSWEHMPVLAQCIDIYLVIQNYLQ